MIDGDLNIHMMNKKQQSQKLHLFAVMILSLLIILPVHAVTIDEERANEITEITHESSLFNDRLTIDEYAEEFDVQRDAEKERIGLELLQTVYNDSAQYWESTANAESMYDAMLFYVSYDFGTTESLGAGERAGVLASWRTVYLYGASGIVIPDTAGDWADILKIANGRWPEHVIRTAYEDTRVSVFEEVYNRLPDQNNQSDNAAIMIMSYGLRPEPRNLTNELIASNYFYSIFGSYPDSAADWDVVRAIAYSGATK